MFRATFLASLFSLTACFEFSAQVMENNVPVATIAEARLTVEAGDVVFLDGSGSTDGDGDPLTFRWAQVEGTGQPVALSDPLGPVASFTAPSGHGSLYFRLTVSDGIDTSAPALVEVVIQNRAPTADLLDPVVVTTGQEVVLLGQGRDPDSDPLTYFWTLVDWPPGGEVSLRGRTEQSASFVPLVRSRQTEPGQCGPGDCYVVQLEVGDGELWSEAVTTPVVSLNRPPFADAGPDREVTAKTALLDGSNSGDPDGDTLTFTWTQLDGPVTLGTDGVFTDMLTVVEVTEPGTYVIALSVSDGIDASPADLMTITLPRRNLPPSLTPAAYVFAGPEHSALPIDVGADDPEGDPLTVTWTKTGGHSLWPESLSGSPVSMAVPDFKTLAVEGENHATYEVVADDGLAASPPVTLTVYAWPSPENFVIVSSVAGAATESPCGSVANPCGSLTLGLEELGGGDGRDLILTSGTFETLLPNLVPVAFPPATSVLGGRDPFNFSAASMTVLTTYSGAYYNVGFRFGSGSDASVVIRHVNFQAKPATQAPYQVVNCDQCAARFQEVEVNCVNSRALRGLLLQNNAQPTVEDSVVSCSASANFNGVGIAVLSGSQLSVRGSRIETAAVTNGAFTAAVNIDATGTATIQQSLLKLSGQEHSTNALNLCRAIVNSGTLDLRNAVVHVSSGPNSVGLFNEGTTSSLHNTVVGPGTSGGAGRGVISSTALSAAGNILTDFPTLYELNGAGRGAKLYGNAYGNSSVVAASCEGTDVAPEDFANASDGTPCNQSAEPWTDNLLAGCPLVNPSLDDFHLNAGVPNPCIDGALATSIAGNAPDDDMDGEPRPDPQGTPDIGADEVNP